MLLSSGQRIATEMLSKDGTERALPDLLPNPAVGFGLVHLVKYCGSKVGFLVMREREREEKS